MSTRVQVRQHQVQISSETEGRVADNTGAYGLVYHSVNLETRFCTCYKYQENDIPCSHAHALILRLNYQYPQVLLPQFCSVDVWRNTYLTNLHPIAYGPHIQQPEPQENEGEGNAGEGNEGPVLACHAPRTRVLRGRPKKERYRRGEGHRLAQRPPGAPEQLCSTCGQPGHNSRTCCTPHE